MDDLKIFVNDEEKQSMAALGSIDQVAGAKVKLDELFVQWLSMPDTATLIQGLVGDAKAGKPLTAPAASALHHSAASLLAKNPVLSPVRGRNSPPPRSPTRSLSPSRTPESKSPGSRDTSPQHFTFGGGGSPDHSPVRPTAMKFADGTSPSAGSGRSGDAARSSLSPPSSASASASALAGAGAGSPPPPRVVPGSAASTAVVPVFFNSGEGGRGRGRSLPGEALTEKLPSILEVWRRTRVDRGFSNDSSRPSGDSAADDEEIQVAGVRVTRRDAMSGLPVEQFAAVAKTLCGFPSFFAAPLFRRVRLLVDPEHRETLEQCRKVCKEAGSKPADPVEDAIVNTEGTVSLLFFLQYWKQEMEPYDHFDRFYRLVSRPGSSGIFLRDFMPLLEELLAFHPGLAFLEGTPEFQEKYARTVIARIFCMLDPQARGSINQRALRRSNLLQAFHTVDMEEDINLVNDYFSYEHFYVLYCKFWELDTDRDFLLTRQDLNRMDNLTHAVLDRVFSQAGRPFTSGFPDRMCYEDFICFLMAEEDKTNEVSLAYWFRTVDLNCDGIITADEMQHFYSEQMQRMADLNLEVVPFQDIMSQMTDLLQPKEDGKFRLSDFLHKSRIRLTGVFFSVLFNLQKFTLFEQRDPVVVKQELNEQGITQWDRFAQFEYMKLAEEEENAGEEPDISMSDFDGMGDMGAFDRDGDGGWSSGP